MCNWPTHANFHELTYHAPKSITLPNPLVGEPFGIHVTILMDSLAIHMLARVKGSS